MGVWHSWDQKKQIGKGAGQLIQQQYGLYDDLQAYVDNIGQEMLAASHFNREGTPDEYEGTDFYFPVLGRRSLTFLPCPEVPSIAF